MCASLRSLVVFTSLLAMLALPSTGEAAVRGRSGDGLEEATRQWKSLSSDRKRRRLRHHWEPVIAGLQRSGERAREGKRAALAFLRAARAAEELSVLSGLSSDAESAAALYLRVVECCADDSLADDALVDAARLEFEKVGRPEVARKHLRRALAMQGDQVSRAKELIAQLPPPPAAVLEDATRDWKELAADPRRRVRRDLWLEVISSLEEVAEGQEGKARAVALMRAGRATQDLARISGRRDDHQWAIRTLVRVADECARDSLADDALLAAAEVAAEVLDDASQARGLLERAVKLGGDMKAPASRMLASLPAPKASPREAVAARPTPAAEPASDDHDHDHDHDHEFALPSDDLGELMAAVDTFTDPDPLAEDQVKSLRRTALSGEWSLSEQAGLKVRRIIIDAGHGGHDSGAVGPGGTKEKDVTLAISRALERELRSRGYETLLTRSDDTYVGLEARTEIANRERGDLFLSIHANAHTNRKKGGVETYSLNVTSDRYAIRLAARENATSQRSVSDLQFLLADLATRAYTVDSARLAQFVQMNLVQSIQENHGPVRDLGVKHALFHVLLGARMPAVLVETSFISNAAEEKKLKSKAYQTTLARAIADGVDQFVARRTQLASAGN